MLAGKRGLAEQPLRVQPVLAHHLLLLLRLAIPQALLQFGLWWKEGGTIQVSSSFASLFFFLCHSCLSLGSPKATWKFKVFAWSNRKK
jgi:hypothetical protein